MTLLAPLEITGQTRSHIVQKQGFALHPAAYAGFCKLQAAAANEGFDLAIFSSFRDFSAQCRIWNLKWMGQRPIFDAQGKEIDSLTLSDLEKLKAILNWSALPGTSRHHWGSDLDLFDQAALKEGQKVELLPWEYDQGGPFYPLSQWLQTNAENFGFFRPYASYQGGVQPEPWHYSYAPISQMALTNLSKELVSQAVDSANLEGKELVIEHLDWILQNFSFNINTPKV